MCCKYEMQVAMQLVEDAKLGLILFQFDQHVAELAMIALWHLWKIFFKNLL